MFFYFPAILSAMMNLKVSSGGAFLCGPVTYPDEALPPGGLASLILLTPSSSSSLTSAVAEDNAGAENVSSFTHK